MRVSFISTGLDVGGAEMALLKLLPAMRHHGIDATVVSIRGEGSVGPKLRAAGIDVLALDLPQISALAVAWPRLLSFMRAFAPDLLHGWMYHGNLAALAGGRRLHLPVAWGIRQSLGPGARDKWLTRRVIAIGAALSANADLIVYNSAAARAQHESRGFEATHVAVLPNGFDTDRLRPNRSVGAAVRHELHIAWDSPVVAQVARFHPAKDYPTLLRAAALVVQRFPHTVFVLVGEGVESSNRQLVRLIGELGLANSVRLLGRRDDVARLMAAFDVVCLTSSGEGFPNAIGEAMSCGVPCVGTAVGDIAELIGDTGEVVPPADPGAVAAAVGRLLSLDPQTRGELGARARNRVVEHFSIGQMARCYADLLRRAVAARR